VTGLTSARQGVMLAGWLVLLCGSAVAAQTVGFTASLTGVRSTYPLEQVDGVYVFHGMDVSKGRVRASVTIPFVRLMSEPVSTLSGTTTLPAPSSSTGFADPVIRVDVRLIESRPRHGQFGLSVAAKPAIVDVATGRGSGRSDYAIGGTAFSTARRTSLMADVLYWEYGNPPDLDVRNALSFSFGAAHVLGSGRWSALASISGFTTGTGDIPAPISLNLGVLTLASGRQSLALNASIGLTDGSSDFAIGTSWRIVI
jgi:hypothetical protein